MKGSQIISRLKRNKELLCFLAVACVGYWAFSYYVFVPKCTHPSKPLTMYLEASPEVAAEGAPERITFRVPSAYLISPAYAPRVIGGKQEFIPLRLNIKKHEPLCLTDYTKTKDFRGLTFITLSGISAKDRFTDFLASQQALYRGKEVHVETGFKGHQQRGSISEILVPLGKTDNPIYFSCISRDSESYTAESGCIAWTMHKNIVLQYTFLRTQLAEWKEIQTQVFVFIDSIITDVEH